MNYKVFYIILACAFLFTSCSDDDDNTPTVTPTEQGTFTDADGSVYGWVRIGGLDWMTTSYHGGEPWNTQTVISNGFETDLYSPHSDEEEDSLILSRGNFYTLQQALDECPEGWRLPTDEDWKRLEVALGMSQSEADKEGWRNGAGYLMQQPLSDGGTGLAMKCAGEITAWGSSVPTMYHEGDYGYYWSSTIDSTKAHQTAYIRVITPVTNKVERVATTTALNFLSVRYVRDAK